MECPFCKSNNVRRSKRRGLERWFSHRELLKAYRCMECSERFFIFLGIWKWMLLMLGLAVVLMSLAGLVIWLILF